MRKIAKAGAGKRATMALVESDEEEGEGEGEGEGEEEEANANSGTGRREGWVDPSQDPRFTETAVNAEAEATGEAQMV